MIDPNILRGNTTLRLTFELNGVCLLSGDASAIIFDQPFGKFWRYVSLSNYTNNCYFGEQIVDIPLSDFVGLDISAAVGTFHARIWHIRPFEIEIRSAILYNADEPEQFTFGKILKKKPTRTSLPTPTFIFLPTPLTTPQQNPLPLAPLSPTTTLTQTISLTPTPSNTPTLSQLPETSPTPTSIKHASWSIQSVSSMKETKDRVCWQRSLEFINRWVDSALELGVNYISIETPYDSPICGDTITYTKLWVSVIRSKGLKVWHRHMPLAFEGIYNTPKNPSQDFLRLISNYIKANSTFFEEGDIFTPIPEPQNGGILGVNYCYQEICIFQNSREFNLWLRTAIDIAEDAFAAIGMGGKIKIGYFGFDGFIAWGDNNPDWNGILEDETVIKMGNITIDHYPEIVGDTMENDLKELEARYPYIPIIIGEWGTISGENREQQVINSLGAARRPSVVGVNYWHQGMGGVEALLEEDFIHRAQFDEVANFYKNTQP